MRMLTYVHAHFQPQPELSNLIANLQSVTPDQASDNSALRTESLPIGREAANLAFFGWQPYRPIASGSGGSPSSSKPPVPDVLHCSICDRKLGLPHFRLPEHTTPSIETHDPKVKTKILDVIREHREFCPIKVYSTASESIEEDPLGREDVLEGEVPWWRSAMILRSEADRGGAGKSIGPDEKHGGNRLEKTEVMSRLRAILGEKQPRLDPRKHIRNVI